MIIRETKLPTRLLILAAFVIAWLAFVIGFAVFMPSNESPQIEFQSELWVVEDSGVRAQMIEDLSKQNDFDKMTKLEVLSLLGEPTETNYFHNYDCVYWLGRERGFLGIDSEWLVFRFDDTGRVTDWAVLTD